MSDKDFDYGMSEYLSGLEKLTPELANSWTEYRDEVFKEGLISAKDKQLIALSCTHITGCKDCRKAITKQAMSLGATKEQISESIFIATRLAMGQPYAFSSIAFENYDLMKNKGDVTKGYFMSKNITPQIKDFHEVSGEKFKKFSVFNNIVYEDGHLSKKLKKGLMGLATAILAKCPWCIRSCVRDGIQEGVTKAEIAEAVNIAIVMNSCPCICHSGTTLEAAGK